jgi:hypothetical protein
MNELFDDPAKPSAFSTLKKLQAAVKKQMKKTTADIKEWLLKQDAYTLSKSLRKLFPRNPYTVKDVLD